jgi:hypothetical protein
MLMKSVFNILIVAVLMFPATVCSQDSYSDQHIEVSLRMIGHNFLLQIGDSTSKVLPIKKEGDQYRIKFDTEIAFQPGDLVESIKNTASEIGLEEDYIVTVHKCGSEEVVYSYEINNSVQSDIIPCRTRDQAKECYELVFTLKPEKSGNVLNTSESKNDSTLLIVILAMVVLAVIFAYLIFQKRKVLKQNPDVISLGKYQFNPRRSELILKEQRIELSGKETELLKLLYDNANQTVERDVILNKVWQDEGDYVGRTLDVFISKLRKKLEADSDIKIANVRGVGYKLVV